MATTCCGIARRIARQDLRVCSASRHARQVKSSNLFPQSNGYGNDVGFVAAGGDVFPFHGASVLFVDRLCHEEALPIFYKVNTFSISRFDLCHDGITNGASMVPDPKHLIHLHLSDLIIMPSCAKSLMDCISCQRVGLDVLQIPQLLPHLRTPTINYGADEKSKEAFALFKAAMRPAPSPYSSYNITCTGIGQYTLHNTDRPKLSIAFLNEPLVRIWHSITPAATKVYAEIGIPKHLYSEQDKYHGLASTIFHLLFKHDGYVSHADRKLVPQVFAAVSPKEVPCDFRKLGGWATFGFVERVDDVLRGWVRRHASSERGQWVTDRWVPRW